MIRVADKNDYKEFEVPDEIEHPVEISLLGSDRPAQEDSTLVRVASVGIVALLFMIAVFIIVAAVGFALGVGLAIAKYFSN